MHELTSAYISTSHHTSTSTSITPINISVPQYLSCLLKTCSINTSPFGSTNPLELTKEN